MEGTAKQVALAEKIKADALDSLRSAASVAPHFRIACEALAEAVSAITDSSWIIANRYNLGLKTGVIYGTDQPTITAQEAFYHQLLRNEFWREPRLRKGISTFTKERQAAIKALFQEAWRLERADEDYYSAAVILERVRKNTEVSHSAADVRRDLGLDD